jgi:hypothetical protein
VGDDLVIALARVAALLLAMAATAASAAPTWTTPSTLPFTLQNGPVVAFAAGGVQFLAYIDVEQPLDVNNAVTRIIVTRTPPGAVAAEDLRIESTATGVPLSVSLAVASSGAAALVYAEATSSDLSPPPPLRWRAAYRAADGVWESPVTLFTDSLFSLDIATSGSQVPLCDIAPDGSAVAGASHVEPDDQPEPPPGQSDARLDVALHPANGSWQAAQRLSPPNESISGFARLAADDDGNFTLAWAARTDEGGTNSTSDDLRTLVLRRLLAGQSVWNTKEIVSVAGINAPSVAVGPSGNAVATFQQGVQVWAATRVDSLHTFAAPEQLVTTAASSAPLAAGAAPDGTSYVLYGFNAVLSNQTNVGIVKRPTGGAWTDPTPVSPLQFDGRDGAIAFRGDDAILVWTADDANDVNNGTHLVEASRWLAGAEAPEGFRDLEELEQGEFLRQVTSDQSGGVLAWWFRGDTFRAAAFDAGGPLLAVSGIPASASAGGTTTFSATFVDLWSPLGAGPTWDFGDGTPAAVGATVGHAYAAPGSYGATVRAADALGNETVVPFTVNVGPEAIPPGVAITLPSCPDRLSSQACERRRRRRKLWQTLRGTATDAAPSSGLAAVEVSVTIVAGKKTLVLNGDRFVRDGDPSVFAPATLEGTSWSLRLPKLRAGRATIVARARDAAGNASETTVEVRLR